MYWPNLQSVALPVPEIIAIAVLGWGCEPQSWGRGGRTGRDGTVRKSVGEALDCNFSSIFTRFRDIAAFVLQHATVPHPTSSVPKFPHVPLGLGGWPLGY